MLDWRSHGRGFESRCCAPTPTQRAIPPGSVNDYQRKLGSKRAYHEMHKPRIRCLTASAEGYIKRISAPPHGPSPYKARISAHRHFFLCRNVWVSKCSGAVVSVKRSNTGFCKVLDQCQQFQIIQPYFRRRRLPYDVALYHQALLHAPMCRCVFYMDPNGPMRLGKRCDY